jgi:hypothetical protein
MASPFAAIMRNAVERTPRAIGGAFAAADGEMVDFFSTIDPDEWAFLTAHNGVILSTLQAAFSTWHFGGVQFFVVEHSKVDVLVHDVCQGYYALLAVEQPAPLGTALGVLIEAVGELRKEMA